jgi:hypothetical protein
VCPVRPTSLRTLSGHVRPNVRHVARAKCCDRIESNNSSQDLVDLRTWYTAEGRLKPGKGFAAEIWHLPRLAAALAKAEAKATELGLITDDNDNGGDQ